MTADRQILAAVYHYVRDPAGHSHAQPPVLDPGAFEAQIDYLLASHSPISIEQCIAALSGDAQFLAAYVR